MPDLKAQVEELLEACEVHAIYRYSEVIESFPEIARAYLALLEENNILKEGKDVALVKANAIEHFLEMTKDRNDGLVAIKALEAENATLRTEMEWIGRWAANLACTCCGVDVICGRCVTVNKIRVALSRADTLSGEKP